MKTMAARPDNNYSLLRLAPTPTQQLQLLYCITAIQLLLKNLLISYCLVLPFLSVVGDLDSTSVVSVKSPWTSSDTIF